MRIDDLENVIWKQTWVFTAVGKEMKEIII